MKLATYLENMAKTRKLSVWQAEKIFSKKISMSVFAIRKYKAGTRIPRPKNLDKIKRATGGSVSETDWYN